MTMWSKELASKNEAERMSVKGKIEVVTYDQTKVGLQDDEMLVKVYINRITFNKGKLFKIPSMTKVFLIKF